MRTLLSFAASICLLPDLSAQLPTDAAIVWELPSSPIPAVSYAIVDVFGGGATTYTFRGPVAFTLPVTAVAADPTDPARLLVLAPAPGFGFVGIGALPIGTTGELAATVPAGPWTHPGGDRIEVGSSVLVTLGPGGVIEVVPKSGGLSQPLAVVANAIDIAIAGPRVFVATFDPASPTAPSPLLEIALGTGLTRTIGSYPSQRSIAAFPGNSTVSVGTDAATILEIDRVTGAVINTTSVAPGTAVEAMAFSRGGTLVYATTQWAVSPGYVLWTLGAPFPIHRSADVLRDLTVTTADTASSVPFGAGCGNGSGAVWSANSTPTPGNANYAIELSALDGNAAVLLLLGADRRQSVGLQVTLPFDLGVLGAPLCQLLVDPLVALQRNSGAAGRVSLNLPVPPLPQLIGNDYFVQAFVPSPSLSLGFAATPALALAVR